MNKEFDLICSIGGNCSAAHNLRYRNMRHFSLPFDWCYFENAEAIKNFATGFQNEFQDFCKKENMLQVEGKAHHSIIFQDAYSKYFFPNHFSSSDLNVSYDKFYGNFRRRVSRLISYIKQSKNILFIVSSKLILEKNIFLELSSALKTLYPDKNIEIRVMLFNQKEQSVLQVLFQA